MLYPFYRRRYCKQNFNVISLIAQLILIAQVCMQIIGLQQQQTK